MLTENSPPRVPYFASPQVVSASSARRRAACCTGDCVLRVAAPCQLSPPSSTAQLAHSSHTTFHKTSFSPEDAAAHATCFYRWHIDTALYDLSPPRVLTLYTLHVPRGLPQVCRYDNGTGDVLSVPLGTTAFSVTMRTRVMYVPHPYAWMGPAHAKSTRLGLECDGIEVELGTLPPWEEVQRKTLPVLWKNPVTGELAFQVHPCGTAELLINSLPESAVHEAALYPDGVHLTDLKETTNNRGAKLAVELLHTTSDSTNTPCLRAIAGASALLMDTVVSVRRNKEECLRMAEQVGTIITLVDICTNGGFELSPSLLNSIATFSETLQKVLVFVRNQVGKSLVKRVVRHWEDASALSECQFALDHAVQMFKLQCEMETAASLVQMQAISTERSWEFANLVMGRESRSTLSTLDSRLSDISLLPGSPKIFHGRD
ncbi:hypothetical protein B0H14DRAFT_3862028, partial [Mycena olivaceomarginata]